MFKVGAGTKVGVLSLSSTYYSDSFQIEIIVNPYFNKNRIPYGEDDFPLAPDIEPAIRYSPNEEVEVGLKLQTSLTNSDISLYFFSGNDRSPSLYTGIISAESSTDLRMDLGYRKTTMLGSDYVTFVGDFTVRAEGAIYNTKTPSIKDTGLENNYFEDQKKKIGIDKYFSDLKSGKPQIFGLYWSKAQSEIRHSKEMETVKKWLNNLWNYNYEGKNVFDPNRELVYADRVRRREPGDDTLGLSPHCDAGSIERWTDKAYQKIYNDIFSDNFENFNPFDAKYRDETIEFESPAVAHVFRTFQGWTALTEQGPNDGTLQLIPIAKGMSYVLTRALLDDVPENELCGSKAGKALSINEKYHSLLLEGLISIPKMNPGDTIWWHPDVVHAVEEKHQGKNYSNVIYVGATPYCKKNIDYIKKQSKKFIEGKSPPDFAPEDYEVNYKGRVTVNDLSELAKKQLGLVDWN